MCWFLIKEDQRINLNRIPFDTWFEYDVMQWQMLSYKLVTYNVGWCNGNTQG